MRNNKQLKSLILIKHKQEQFKNQKINNRMKRYWLTVQFLFTNGVKLTLEVSYVIEISGFVRIPPKLKG
jgi:hypothetical protein